jgi:palmitoyltransferase ZDHHC2/15/20
MDHHCPWVANCIGFFNYKYFINMLFYTATTLWYLVLSSYPLLSHVLDHDSIDYKFSYYVITSQIMASVLGLVITLFFIFHLWLITKQYSTIEFCEKRNETESNFKVSPYNRGIVQNFKNILGENPFFWLVPFCKKSLQVNV